LVSVVAVVPTGTGIHVVEGMLTTVGMPQQELQGVWKQLSSWHKQIGWQQNKRQLEHQGTPTAGTQESMETSLTEGLLSTVGMPATAGTPTTTDTQQVLQKGWITRSIKNINSSRVVATAETFATAGSPGMSKHKVQQQQQDRSNRKDHYNSWDPRKDNGCNNINNSRDSSNSRGSMIIMTCQHLQGCQQQ
jgi:hypothetical protein